MVSIPLSFMPLLLCAVLCRCSRWLSCVLSFCSCTARVFIHSLSAPLYRPLSSRSAIVPLSWPVLCWPSVYLLPLPVRCIGWLCSMLAPLGYAPVYCIPPPHIPRPFSIFAVPSTTPDTALQNTIVYCNENDAG